MTKPTLKVQVAVLCRQLGIDPKNVEWDHIHAKALGGADDRHNPDNWQCLPGDKHKTKTFGPGGEKRITTYGSDIHAMAKIKRLTDPKKGSEMLRKANLAKAVKRERERQKALINRKAKTKWR